MSDATKYGIIGTLILLISSGAVYMITDTEKVNSYICSSTQQVGIFYGGISSTGLTAYPFKENKTQSAKCTKGTWVSLNKYVADNNINLTPGPKEEPVIIINIQSSNKYRCYVNNTCVAIN